MTFFELGLSEPILTALTERGYSNPTAIQQQAIAPLLAGRDIVASAQTGTGKTASFVLPLLEMFSGTHTRRAKRLRALILVPTRELAMQVEATIGQYGKHLDIRSMAMVGGVDGEAQKQRLIDGIDILVATPGRLLDMAHQRALYFDELKALVLDEADRMLDMGFIGDINKIIERLPTQRQTMLFSATLSDDVRQLARTAIDNAVEVSVLTEPDSGPQIDQWLVTVDKDNKSALLSHLIEQQQWGQALIFIRTKHGAAKLVTQLEKRGIEAEAIHSGRSQVVRSQLLQDFKSGQIKLLVATGIAARGIDIDDLQRVVNYDLPDDADDYIHRIGRTGRAGARGEAISLVSRDDFKRLCAIEGRQKQVIPRRDIEGFGAQKTVPISVLNHIRTAAISKTRGHGNKPPKKEASLSSDTSHSSRKSSATGNKNNSAKSSPASTTQPWGNWQKDKGQ